MAGEESIVSNELLVHWIEELLADKESPAYATVSDIENNYLESNPGNCIQILKSNSGVTSRMCRKTNALPLVGYGVDRDECRARLLSLLNSLRPKEDIHA